MPAIVLPLRSPKTPEPKTPEPKAPEPTKTPKEIGRALAAEDHVSIAIAVLPFRYDADATRAREAVREWCVRRLDAVRPVMRASLEQYGQPIDSSTLDLALNEWYYGLDAIVRSMWR